MSADRRYALPADDMGDFDEDPEEFHQLGPIGKAATILLGCATVTHLLSTLSDWNTYRVVRDYLGGKPNVEDAQLNTADTIARLTSIPNVAVSVAAAVVFVLWLWRARLNSEVFCRADHRHGHGWVLGGWLCPGPNLVYPKQIVADVWTASDRTTPPWADDLDKYKRPFLINVWWVCWVGAMLLDVVLRRVLMWIDPTVSSLRITALSGSVALVLTVASAGFATLIIRRINGLQTGRPWIAWWEAEEQPALRSVNRRRELAYAGSGTALGETRYMAAVPSYEEPQPAFDEAAFARAMSQPAIAEPAMAKPAAMTEPVFVNAAQLSVVPDPPQPSWSNSTSAETGSRYTDSSTNLVGLPSLPNIPSTPAPEPEPEKPAWSPFASVVEEWQHEEEEAQVPEPPQGMNPGSTVWPAEQETRVWPAERSAGDFLNPAAPIPSPPTPPLTLVPEPADYGTEYRTRYPEPSQPSEPSRDSYSYDGYRSPYDETSYGSEYQRPESASSVPSLPSVPETGYQSYDRSSEYRSYGQPEYTGYDAQPSYEPAPQPPMQPPAQPMPAQRQAPPAPDPAPQPEARPEPKPERSKGRRFRPGPADQPSATTTGDITRRSHRSQETPSYETFETTASLSSSYETPSYDEPRFDRAPTFERSYEPQPRPEPRPEPKPEPKKPEPPRFEAAPILSTRPEPMPEPRPEPKPEPRYESNTSYSSYEPSYDDRPANDYGDQTSYGSYGSGRQSGSYRSEPQTESYGTEQYGPETSAYALPPYQSDSPFGQRPEQRSYDPEPKNLPSAPLAPRSNFVDVEPEQQQPEEQQAPSQPRTYPRRRWSV